MSTLRLVACLPLVAVLLALGAAWVRDLLSIVRAVPGNRGLGFFYWDATWTGVPWNGWSPRDPSSGNAWENQALFDYDDRPLLPALSEFRP